MTSPLIALNSSTMRTHGWLRQNNFAFAASDTVVPLLLGELAAALPIYTLAFARRPSAKALLVVLLGLRLGQNHFVDAQGRWLAPYIPSHLRGYPFGLHSVEGAQSAEQQRLLLCFNRQSGLYREQPDPARNEARFFDDEGKLQPDMQQILNFLQMCASNEQQTQTAVDALDAAGLLQPWVLPASTLPGSEPVPLQGLFRIDESALKQLGAEQLLTLHQANALPVAYAQLLSMPRIGVLQQLAQTRQKALAAQASVAAVPDFSIAQKLFDSDQSDTLHFNF